MGITSYTSDSMLDTCVRIRVTNAVYNRHRHAEMNNWATANISSNDWTSRMISRTEILFFFKYEKDAVLFSLKFL